MNRKDDLVYVPVGPDRFRAHLIAAACNDEGLAVELLTADDDGTFPWYGVTQPYRLLVHRSDLDKAQTRDRSQRSLIAFGPYVYSANKMP
ncbi:MAG: hypothetical protein GWP04_10160 [Gammaproteobacteria bacterium]|nr:hypothetical protein [Gammaproteobacteria bacterium]